MNHSIKTTVQQSLLEQLFAANKRTLISSAFLALILAYVQRKSVSTDLILAWLSLILLTNLVRYLITKYHITHPTSDVKVTRKRLMEFRIGVIVSGLAWGMSSILIYPHNDIQGQMFIIFMLTGLAAGGIVSYSVDIVSAISYTFIILTPILIRLFLDNSAMSFTMGVSGLLYLVFMLLSIRNINQNFLENITLRHDAVERENEIKQLAFYDPLTNLPNRRLLLDRLDHALTVSARSGRRGAYFFWI